MSPVSHLPPSSSAFMSTQQQHPSITSPVDSISNQLPPGFYPATQISTNSSYVTFSLSSQLSSNLSSSSSSNCLPFSRANSEQGPDQLGSSSKSNYLPPSLSSAFPQQLTKPRTQPISAQPHHVDMYTTPHYTAPVAILQNDTPAPSVTGALPAARTTNAYSPGQQRNDVMVSGFHLPRTELHSNIPSTSEQNFSAIQVSNASPHQSPQLSHAPLGRRATVPRLATHQKSAFPSEALPAAPGAEALSSEGQELYYRRYSSPGKLERRQKSRHPSQQLSAELVAEHHSEEAEYQMNTEARKNQLGGYDYPFVSRTDAEDHTCPICCFVLREPFLTDCCGQHYCRLCIKPVHEKNQPCPFCMSKEFNVMVNRAEERKVRELKVQCPQFLDGCRWTGTLGKLEEHIDRFQGSCQFIAVECHLGCGKLIVLSKLDYHVNEECQRRPYSCKFCGHKAIFEDIPTYHWPECKGYPVPCPYNCMTPDMPRRDLDDHMFDCPCRSVSCDFEYAGCTDKFPYNKTEVHMKEETHKHVSLLSELVKQLMATKNPEPNETTPTEKKLESDEQDKQLVGLTKMLKDREGELEQVKMKVESLQEEVEELRCDITQLRTIIFVPPFYFSVQEVSRLRLHKEQWFSPPFYTHMPNGYKMCISIDCGGSDEGTGTHISVYANLMKGENDDLLRWPFRGTITIRMINWRSNTSHCEHDIPFVRDTPREIAGRVTKQDIAESGLGVPKFLPLIKLNPSETVEYLHNDTLQFCVVKVRIDVRK